MFVLVSLSGSHQLRGIPISFDPTCNTVGRIIKRICSLLHINVFPSSPDLYLLPSSTLWGGEPDLSKARLLDNDDGDDITLLLQLSHSAGHVLFIHNKENEHCKRNTVCLKELSRLKPSNVSKSLLTIDYDVELSKNEGAQGQSPEDIDNQSRSCDINSKPHNLQVSKTDDSEGRARGGTHDGCDLKAIVRHPCSEVVSETEFEGNGINRGQSALPGSDSYRESRMLGTNLNVISGDPSIPVHSSVLVNSRLVTTASSSFRGDGLRMELSETGMKIPRLDVTTVLPPFSSDIEVVISEEEIDLTITDIHDPKTRLEQCNDKEMIVISSSEDDLPKIEFGSRTHSRLSSKVSTIPNEHTSDLINIHLPEDETASSPSKYTSDLISSDIHLSEDERSLNELPSCLKEVKELTEGSLESEFCEGSTKGSLESKFPEGSTKVSLESKFPEGSTEILEVDSRSDEGIVMEESESEDVMVVGVEGEVGVRDEQIISILRAEFQRSPSMRWDVRRAMRRLRRVFGSTVEDKQLLVVTTLGELQKEAQDGGSVPLQLEPALITCCGIQLLEEDLDTLLPSGWLNDQVINCYMKLLVESCSKQKVHVMSTFFYPKLVSGGYRGVERWLRNVDIFRLHLLLIPIHLGMIHWCLAAVNFRRKTIEYFDSMGGRNRKCFKQLMMLLLRSAQRRNHCIQRQHWRKCYPKGIPRQHNTCDCGVFVCQFARWLCHNGCSHSEIPFRQKHIPMIRRAMIQEIKTSRLIDYDFLY